MKFRVIETEDGWFELQVKYSFWYYWETYSYKKSLLECRKEIKEIKSINNGYKIKRIINIKELEVIE